MYSLSILAWASATTALFLQPTSSQLDERYIQIHQDPLESNSHVNDGHKADNYPIIRVDTYRARGKSRSVLEHLNQPHPESDSWISVRETEANQDDVDGPISYRDDLTSLNIQNQLPSCSRKYGKLRTRREWTVSYANDAAFNGIHCGQSVRKQIKSHLMCKPMSDWKCIPNGTGGVTIQFHTPRGCTDETVHQSILKGTQGQVNVWCQKR